MKVNRKLIDEFSDVPDLSKQIKQSVNWEQIKQNNKKQVVKAKKSFTLRMSLVSAFSLVLIFSIFMIPSILKNLNPSDDPVYKPYLITIDVNPSIRLEVNENDVVITQYGLNEDGIIFLYKENYVGLNVDLATTSIVDKLEENGFLEENDIQICVKDSENKEYKEKEDKVKEKIKNHIEEKYENVILNDLEDTTLNKIEDNYKNNNIKEKEQEISEEYKDKVLEKAKEKLNKMKGLLLVLSLFKGENGEFIIDFPSYIKVQLEEFFDTYNDENIHENFNKENPTYKDMNTLYDELEQKANKIEEAINKIEQGESEEEYKEIFKDLYNLVEDDMIEERKNNKNPNNIDNDNFDDNNNPNDNNQNPNNVDNNNPNNQSQNQGNKNN